MSEIPQWKEENIGNKLKLLSGFPFFSSRFSTEEGMPLIRIRDVLDSKIETYYTGSYLPMYVIRQGDILIGMDGDFHISKWNNQDALLNQRVLKIEVLDSNEMDLEFVFYWLQPFIKKVNDITAATTVKHLSVKDVKKAKGKIPKKPVQTKIGVILSNIDRAIESTQALIEKYQLIKAGLMHDLFTRGIGADGKLRPPREAAPELYQETAIGWIPKEWTVEACKTMFLFDSGITLGVHRRPKNNPRPYLRVANVFKEKIKLHDIAYLEASDIEQEKYQLKTFDLLLVEGHANIQEIGRCGMVMDNAEGMLYQNHLFRLKALSVTPNFGLYLLNSHIARSYWERTCSTSSGLNTINQKMLGNMPLCQPSITEQSLIENRISSINHLIDKENTLFEKLRKQKAGLMHDLLMGKVQVKVDDDESDN